MAKVKVKNQALDILSSISDSRCRALLTQIVKMRPSVVIAASNALTDVHFFASPLQILFSKLHLESPTLEKIIKRAANHNGKIGCIKICRALTGEGLKEAKDYVESVVQHWPHASYSSVFPTVVNGDHIKLEPAGEASYYSFVTALLRLIYDAKYEKAFDRFIGNYGLQNNEVSVSLFGQFLKSLYVIE